MMIYNIEDHITPLWLWEWSYKIHCNNIPRSFRNFSREVLDWLDGRTNQASSDIFLNVGVHVNPVVVSLDQFFCIVDARVSSGDGVMMSWYDSLFQLLIPWDHNWFIFQDEAVKLFPAQAILHWCFFECLLYLFVDLGSAVSCFLDEDVF